MEFDLLTSVQRNVSTDDTMRTQCPAMRDVLFQSYHDRCSKPQSRSPLLLAWVLPLVLWAGRRALALEGPTLQCNIDDKM